MALKIYPAASPDNPFSQDGVMTNPIREAFDGRLGEIREVEYWVASDNTNTYTSITLSPVSTGGRNILAGTDGYSWKLKAGDTQPTADEWRSITSGNSISLDDISSSGDFRPFWIRMEVPRGASVESFEDLVLRISATETI
jgi:hypothetical protein